LRARDPDAPWVGIASKVLAGGVKIEALVDFGLDF